MLVDFQTCWIGVDQVIELLRTGTLALVSNDHDPVTLYIYYKDQTQRQEMAELLQPSNDLATQLKRLAPIMRKCLTNPDIVALFAKAGYEVDWPKFEAFENEVQSFKDNEGLNPTGPRFF